MEIALFLALFTNEEDQSGWLLTSGNKTSPIVLVEGRARRNYFPF